VTHDGHTFLVVWSEEQLSHTVIKGAEVTTGKAKALPYTIAALSKSLVKPAVAGWAWRYLVLSQETSNNVHGTRLSRFK
jgi:hypothetical protein